jgi:GNAT superfamily N-acetyltransferase
VPRTKQNKPMINIRKAVSEDSPSIIDFQIRMAWETEKLVLDSGTVIQGVNAVFNNHARGDYFVVTEEETVIASLLITYEWSDWRNCNVWWFQSVYVLPEYRRRGIFRRMYNYIKDQAVLQGAAGLRLYVETGNEVARNTYEALGMSSEHYSFYEWMMK